MEVNDVISRQAAITLPVMPKEHREYQTFNLDDAYEQGWNDLQKCIEALPSAQPTEASCWGCNCPKMERLKEQKTFSEMVHLHDAEPQWIPCSERLPKLSEHKNDMVLVCYENGSVRFNTCWHGEWTQGNPIAWMPLPEPWKGAEHETD